MGFKKDELEKIESAIVDLMIGKRVKSVNHGDMKVEYSEMSLDDLLNLRRQIKENDGATTKKRQVIFATSKGVK